MNIDMKLNVDVTINIEMKTVWKNEKEYQYIVHISLNISIDII